jgi:UDP-3-O-[3-hydroxymyristoyl] glucosamine N-acyltransferase
LVYFILPNAIFEAREKSLSWVKSSLNDIDAVLKRSKASIILCDTKYQPDIELLQSKTFIQTDNPAITFLRVVKALFGRQYTYQPGIHPTAIVGAQAKIGKNVYIGPFAIIGNCTIGDNCVIESHAKIHDHVQLGNHVLISEYCNIGGQGFGHILNENGILENMLHIGKVIIEDHVEIFPYTNVDRATLSNTVIGRHTKIDHFCHIGHNTKIGNNTVITAKVVLCGGSAVGGHSWIGVGAVIKEGIKVGNKVTVGMGSMVTKPIPDDIIVAGSPARELSELKKINSFLSKIKNEDLQ